MSASAPLSRIRPRLHHLHFQSSQTLCSACRRQLHTKIREQYLRTSSSALQTRRLPPSYSFGVPRRLLTTQPAPTSPTPPSPTTPPPPDISTSISEDDIPNTIYISPRATSRLLQIQSQDHDPNLHLRVSVTSGGCHGFQYLMSLVPGSDVNAEEGDMVFEEAPEGSQEKARVVMDEPSLELLKGSTVDYTQELIGSQFKIVGNPRAKSSCGCGTSFDVEE
ncbi:MAG: hypothetical protein M1834_000018 [Cirrosporium novae-zelandiae]|nr:MAG: hypothetical protein M1834_000018 [Cirrosporium novae-zelandiae]